MQQVRHFWLRNNMGQPIACVATTVELSQDKSNITFAIAAFNPKDKFDRKKGVELAKVRLEKSRNNRFWAYATNGKSPKQAVMEVIRDTARFSAPVRDSARLWLAFRAALAYEAIQGETIRWRGAIVKRGALYLPIAQVYDELRKAREGMRLHGSDTIRISGAHENIANTPKSEVTITSDQNLSDVEKFWNNEEENIA